MTRAASFALVAQFPALGVAVFIAERMAFHAIGCAVLTVFLLFLASVQLGDARRMRRAAWSQRYGRDIRL